MRKFALAATAFFVFVGVTLATEVVFLGYDKDKKELKVKDGDKEETYKVTDKTVFKTITKDGDKDLDNDKGIARLEKMDGNDKIKGKAKIEITTDKDTLKEVKIKGGKKQ
jgi:hypothetical protein